MPMPKVTYCSSSLLRVGVGVRASVKGGRGGRRRDGKEIEDKSLHALFAPTPPLFYGFT